MGVPLSVVISPLVVAVAVLLTDVVGLVVDTPDLLAPFRDALSGEPFDAVTVIVPLVVALIVPGAVTLFACWLVVRHLLAHAGSGFEVVALGGRPPAAGDIEERQLVHVVEEIALAAGLPPPSVHLVDSAVANAAAVGSSPTDAAIVVSRGLLDTLGRDETQGVIAHLVGRVGNGDLSIARSIVSLYLTVGLVAAVLSAPRDRSARRAIRSVLGLAIRPLSARRHPERMAAASVALLQAQRGGGEDDTEATSDAKFTDVLFLPVAGADLAFSMNQMILAWLLVTPLMKRAWKTRLELADATAVELTRHPDGMAKGLAQLSEQGGLIPGTEAMAHLFVVGHEAGERRHLRRQEAQRAQVQAVARTRGVDRIRALTRVAAAQNQALGREQRLRAARPESPLVGFHPGLGHRVDRLAAMGATVGLEGLRPRSGPMARVLLVVVGGPFLLLFLVIMIGICIAVTGVAFALYMLFFVGPVLALDAALRG